MALLPIRDNRIVFRRFHKRLRPGNIPRNGASQRVSRTGGAARGGMERVRGIEPL